MVKKLVGGKETEVEKEWSYFEFSPYKYLSFIEFREYVSNLGAGLKAIGLGKGDKLHLYGVTRQGIFSVVDWTTCLRQIQYELDVTGSWRLHQVHYNCYCI
jgi:long-subunit acyl-CoA synthetase (AMP-forming)